MNSLRLIAAVLALVSAACFASGAAGQVIYYVDGVCGDDAWTGTDSNCAAPDGPKATIQAAIDDTAVVNDDEIIVEPGTYSETINFSGKAITLRSAFGPDVTTIDGTGLNDSVVKCVTGEGPGTVLQGFTITGGTGDGGLKGGGMFNNNASNPTVRDCTFVGNTARDGGGMYNRLNSSPMVTGCRFITNIVTGPTASAGGGMHNANGSSPTVINCTFSENSAQDMGGGMYNYNNSPPLVINCTFVGNTAERGAGMLNQKTSENPILTNCTFRDNIASLDGGGMYNLASSPIVSNCVLWGNSDGSGMLETAQIHDDASSASAVNYSDIQGGWTGAGGTGNIDADPMFDPSSHLLGGSPCIDSGDTTALPSGIFVDLAGNGRVIDDPATPDAGIPASLQRVTVDMGAFEFQGPSSCDCNADGVFDGDDIPCIVDKLLNP